MLHNHIHGIGNGIVDELAIVPDALLASLSLPKGTYRAVSENDYNYLRRQSAPHLHGHQLAAGSVANSVFTIAELGGLSALSCRIAKDAFGDYYMKELFRADIDFAGSQAEVGFTGRSLALVSKEDGERTLCTAAGVAADFSRADIDFEKVKAAAWLFVEGFILLCGAAGASALKDALDVAKEQPARRRPSTALSLSAVFVVERNRSLIGDLLEKTDLLFGNEGEAKALTQRSSLKDALEALSHRVPNYVITAGKSGAFVKVDGEHLHVAAATCAQVLDTTGAGDAFAGAFLFGLSRGYSPVVSAAIASKIAARIVGVYGARLESGYPEIMKEAVAGAVEGPRKFTR